MDQNRRSLLRDSLVLGVALGAPGIPLTGGTFQKSPNAGERGEKEPEVTATEDLIREHGVIRRALLVYVDTAPKPRQNSHRRCRCTAASGATLPNVWRGLSRENAGRAAHFSRDSEAGRRT